MPFKFNASRRDKFAKAKYRVSNRAEYNEALRQRGDVTGPVRRFIGDGAYDGAPTAAAIQRAFGSDVELIIPPPRNAVPGECATRNAHIDMIARDGRMAWQKITGYGQRSRGEAQIGRYKQVIGPQLRGRKMETQTTERWSQSFRPAFKVDRMMKVTIQNEEKKEPFA